ncbi:MAG: hypothetical protein GWM92_12635 [Gemmatimonadetes bacterium]|nr:hypothetical protein [Gemmatimonadota bacterium]NIR77127.1 hypothetical protein [Gemmatimonadota bacterium]NIT88225.1 hypothetical protein [Gemmatimonadota bacterium]NIU32033.1 hypothetical protein [Gemmatimonadota bacterium]NIU36642.1 hypothetical protein [Gemmatimonadota bacterium]
MRPGRAVPCLLAAGVLLAGPGPGRAQADPAPADTTGEAPGDAVGVSPGGAFLRSILVPGWGHAAVGSYTRGGFYFLTSGGTFWMIFKTSRFLGAARDRVDAVEGLVEAGLAARGVTDPDSITATLESDNRVAAARDLEEVRSQQMEDWIAFGVFWLLLNGADAFVSAHLADFPEPIEVETSGIPGPGGRMEVKVSVPVGGRP